MKRIHSSRLGLAPTDRRRFAENKDLARACAEFVLSTALSEGVRIGVVASPFGPSISTWAPDATSDEAQRDCQEVFGDAVQRHWLAIRSLYAPPAPKP
jgi:hypothetical protein